MFSQSGKRFKFDSYPGYFQLAINFFFMQFQIFINLTRFLYLRKPVAEAYFCLAGAVTADPNLVHAPHYIVEVFLLPLGHRYRHHQVPLDAPFLLLTVPCTTQQYPPGHHCYRYISL